MSHFSSTRSFVEWNDPFAFTFLDPAHVVLGCHLIPAFAEGRTSTLLREGKSAARVLVAEETDDWLNFYVGMCVLTRVGLPLDTGHDRSAPFPSSLPTAHSEVLTLLACDHHLFQLSPCPYVVCIIAPRILKHLAKPR